MSSITHSDSILLWPEYFKQVMHSTIQSGPRTSYDEPWTVIKVNPSSTECAKPLSMTRFQPVPIMLPNVSWSAIKVNKELNEKVSLFQGDITKLAVDVIVNAANKTLRGGGGVDGAIHKAAGRELLVECTKLKRCDVGCAKITKGYNLPAKYVIHTVGPQGENPDLLRSCYESCLDLAVEKKLRTIAFPCISTGVFGYPQEGAAIVALSTIRAFLQHDHSLIGRIIFCVFLDKDKEFYEKYLPKFFPLE